MLINPTLPSELKFRLSVTGVNTVGEYHLKIYDVRLSDEGTYRCESSGLTGTSTSLQLTVIS